VSVQSRDKRCTTVLVAARKVAVVAAAEAALAFLLTWVSPDRTLGAFGYRCFLVGTTSFVAGLIGMSTTGGDTNENELAERYAALTRRPRPKSDPTFRKTMILFAAGSFLTAFAGYAVFTLAGT